jgi:hypothetical protein
LNLTHLDLFLNLPPLGSFASIYIAYLRFTMLVPAVLPQLLAPPLAGTFLLVVSIHPVFYKSDF